MFIYVEDSKITGFNASTESGITENEHWKYTEESISEPITEEHGVPLYKYVDGHITDRTNAEIQTDIAELERQHREEELKNPSSEERIKELEDAVIELAELVGG